MNSNSDFCLNKFNLSECVQDFKIFYVNNFWLSYTVDLSLSTNDLENYKVRSTAWKLFLSILPYNNNMTDWITTVHKSRCKYKSLVKEYTQIKKFDLNPLEKTNKNKWNTIHEDHELKKIIHVDIERTYQSYTLLKKEEIKAMLNRILFLWAKENSDVSYKQGMNEILGVTVFAFYPFYFNYINKLSYADLLEQVQKENLSENTFLIKEIYQYLNDSDHLEADIYTAFNSIMKRGISNIYYIPEDYSTHTPKNNSSLSKVSFN